MIAMKSKSFLLVAATILGAAPFAFSQRVYEDGSLSLRDFDGYYSELSARSFEPLSIREYIDEQIDLALREYDDIFDELTARHTEKTIKAEIKKFEGKIAEGKALLKDAKKRFKAAQKNRKNDEKEYQAAKTHLDGIQGPLEYNEEQLSYWKSQKASPEPASAPGSPGKGKGKK
ncbi:hypothetical protein BKA70DRAFT_1405274, partial [Coprinopsis sp. MPI-PUGE-AT-0042]